MLNFINILWSFDTKCQQYSIVTNTFEERCTNICITQTLKL